MEDLVYYGTCMGPTTDPHHRRTRTSHRGIHETWKIQILQELLSQSPTRTSRQHQRTPFRQNTRLDHQSDQIDQSWDWPHAPQRLLWDRIVSHTPLPTDEADPGVWFLHTDAARDITTICCWWLLRGIEAAAAKMHHVWRQHTALATTTFFTLPIQKNDTTGMCVSRGHNCICERQKKNPICPHCAMIRHEKRVRTLFPRNDTIAFIPEPEGTHPSKQTIIQIFRRAIQSTGTTLQRPGPQGEQIQRFSEHVCRVSGAQFLTRLGYSLDAVQLIGRWGSDAIKRYIQDSPLVRPLQRTEHQTEDHIRKIVQDQMTRSFNQFWIVHGNSGITHIPAITETCTDNRRWHTICGWHYGTSTFQKTYVKPNTNRCLKCFRYTNEQDTQELDISGSETDELWAQQDKKERSRLRVFMTLELKPGN